MRRHYKTDKKLILMTLNKAQKRSGIKLSVHQQRKLHLRERKVSQRRMNEDVSEWQPWRWEMKLPEMMKCLELCNKNCKASLCMLHLLHFLNIFNKNVNWCIFQAYFLFVVKCATSAIAAHKKCEIYFQHFLENIAFHSFSFFYQHLHRLNDGRNVLASGRIWHKMLKIFASAVK